jgi:hypothetical protein
MEKLLKLQKWCEANLFYIIIIIMLLGWFDLFIFRNINLVSADLGRHLKNGEIFLKNHEIPKTNFYSYTNPDFPFVNHHWGSGVVFYLIWQFLGFPGVSLFFITLSLLTFAVFFVISKQNSGLAVSIPVALLVIPLLGERAEVRPEVFSYFFSSIFFWILWNYHKNIISYRWLFILPFLEIIWVNFHIYFVVGFMFAGAFWLEELMNHSKIIAKIFARKVQIGYKKFKKLSLIFFLTISSSFINPYGAVAVFYPFNIFRNYGYRVIENQSVWFLERLGVTHDSNYLLYKIVAITLIVSFILLFLTNRRRFSLSLFGISTVLCVMAGMAIRNFTIFGFIALLAISYNTGYILRKKFSLNDLNLKLAATLIAIAIFSFTFWKNNEKIMASGDATLGLFPGVNNASDFFKDQKIQGPIFNNYDIGGYLIYHLFPGQKVFIDNRPEAYPVSFFEQVYIPMQENNETWKKVDSDYNFNVIFFYTNDVTPWGQNFLITRIDDPDWAPVFADNFAIIFLRRNELNKSTIEKFEIPRSNFGVTKNK